MFFKKFLKKTSLPKDTRTQIAPTISSNLKERIESLAYIVDHTVQTICVYLFTEGVEHHHVVSYLSPYLQTGAFVVEPTIFYGHASNKKLVPLSVEDNDRVYIRFDDFDMQNVELMASLFDVSDSHAVAIFLDASIRHKGIVENLLMNHNRRMAFDEITIDELQKLMQFIDRKNPYKAEWNPHLLTIVNGPTRRPRTFLKMTEKMIDRETYRWTLD